MTGSEIIAAFGGPTATAALLGCGRTSVGHWPHNGVPAKHWPALVDAARERGIEGITFDALRATKALVQHASEAA